MHRVGPSLISVQDSTLEAGKPVYNLDISFMKLQGLPSGEVIAMVCHSAGKGHLFDALERISENFLLLADHLRMQMASFGGSKGPRRMLRCGRVIWEGKGVNKAWLTYQ